jgi:hypothetical protein
MLAAVGALTLVLSSTGWCQQGTGTGTGTGSGATPGTGSSSGRLGPLSGPAGTTIPTMPTEPDLSTSLPTTADQEKARAIDRQKQLVLDTQRLLALANELKADVDKSSKDTLSLDVIRKADEIEKLAHTVKEKMKGN